MEWSSKIKKIALLYFVACSFFSMGQVAPNKYWVQFTDKNNSPFSLSSPAAFLSQRAIDRRANQAISYNDLDLPVNPSYVSSVTATGAIVLNRSKWLNGVLIQTTNASQLSDVQALSCVAFTKSANTKNIGDTAKVVTASKFVNENGIAQANETELEYGYAYAQIAQVTGQSLHSNDYRGQDKIIAVLDDGFSNCNTLAAFSHLYTNNKVLSTWDFVQRESNVYNDGSHGTQVFSVMGAYLFNQYIGTAPGSSYILLRSEDSGTEYIIEEYNWVCAAEYADSAGADIISSSVSYNKFNNAAQNHVYADLDGDKSVITKGADWAASKGILVVNSAGNEGATTWKYICVPADGDSVLAVGAVSINGNYFSLSSIGPSADGRIKPDVCALGDNAAVISSAGIIQSSNGTSFSTPIIAGLAACLWQANPTLTNMEILDYIKKSSSIYNNPTNYLGYGIPNFAHAWFLITGKKEEQVSKNGIVALYPNPFNDRLTIVFNPSSTDDAKLEIMDVLGKSVYTTIVHVNANDYNKISIEDVALFSKGIYFLKIENKEQIEIRKIVKE